MVGCTRLILAYSTLGILANLLLFPLINKEGNRWISIFSRAYYITLLPLIILLYLAISTRVAEYGITEPRYYGFVLMVWLLLIAIYFVVSKKKNIKAIPYSLAIIAFATVFGPWSASSISINDQKTRTLEMMDSLKIFGNGKLKSDIIVTNDEQESLQSQFEYLDNRGELGWLIDEVNQRGNLALNADSVSWFNLEDSLGIVSTSKTSKKIGTFVRATDCKYNIDDKTSFLQFSFPNIFNDYITDKIIIINGEHEVAISKSEDEKELIFEFDDDSVIIFNFQDIQSKFNRKYSESRNENNELVFKKSNNIAEVAIFIKNIRGHLKEKKEINLQNASGFAFIKWKK
jgi:hypothetical protein